MGPALALLVLLVLASSSAVAEEPDQLLEFTRDSCRGWETKQSPAAGYARDGISEAPITFRERRIGKRYRLDFDATLRFELEVIERGGKASRFVGSMFNNFGDPLMLLAFDRDCDLQVARRISYNIHGQAIEVSSLDQNLEPRGEPEPLNPPLEFLERSPRKALKHPGDATPLRVGMIDSGVNYLLPEINRRLARDEHGELVGYDFWEMDQQPFDAHPVDSGFFVQRHGTRTAALLLREAPDIELVPYRYPRPDMSRMLALVEHAAANRVDIIGMPLGSNRIEDWTEFADAARAHPRILFIASAGNDGRDIDTRPVYPAALDLDNLLVVTSADDFVRPAARTNWGRISVDYLLPAERLATLDFDGSDIRVSGSSYAVSRLAALAARIKSSRRELRAADIVAELRLRYGNVTAAAHRWVGVGYIPDPLAAAAPKKRPLPALEIDSPAGEGGFALPLDMLVLDQRWTHERVEKAVRQAYEILAQCGVSAGALALHAVDGADYLRDLSTGSAHTLLASRNRDRATVVFARDTRMQDQFTGEAFGLANTRMRPWLENSVWLMLDVDDPGIALAHELFHVLANSGAHVEGQANLMQGNTRPDSTALTAEQCAELQTVGSGNGLLD